MKILHEGKPNKRMAWFVKCNICCSELRIIEGDPHATKEVCYNCDANQYYIRYICPVCHSKNAAWTESSFGVKANSQYKEILLNEEDMNEINNWGDGSDLTSDEKSHINNRFRV